MASTNKTSNLNLSQFIATDTPTWLVDYNGDMEKIDTGVGRVEELAQTASTQAVGVASGLQTTNQTVTTLSGQVANVQNQANTTTASVNGINQKLGNTNISGIGDGTITGAISKLQYVTEKVELGSAMTLNANSTFTITFNVEKAGYIPIAVCAWALYNRDASEYTHVNGIEIGTGVNSGKVYIQGKYSESSTGLIPDNAYVVVLYQAL